MDLQQITPQIVPIWNEKTQNPVLISRGTLIVLPTSFYCEADATGLSGAHVRPNFGNSVGHDHAEVAVICNARCSPAYNGRPIRRVTKLCPRYRVLERHCERIFGSFTVQSPTRRDLCSSEKGRAAKEWAAAHCGAAILAAI